VRKSDRAKASAKKTGERIKDVFREHVPPLVTIPDGAPLSGAPSHAPPTTLARARTPDDVLAAATEI
jgi:hypothetical protein